MKKMIKSETILAMAMDKSRLEKRMDAWSDVIAQHLAKCAMYGDTLPGDKYNHWIEDEIATYIRDTNDIVCKHNKRKLKPKQYEDKLFGWLSNDAAEARSNLHDLQIHNKKSSQPYPYVEVDDVMVERMRKISEQVIKVFVPLLASVNSATKYEIETKLHEIIDPVCKGVVI